MKPGELDLNEPIIMVWRDKDAKLLPWRFAIWYHEHWFHFPGVKFVTQAGATRIARNALEAMREKAKFKPL